jgi:putative thiamine transport system ATP-binding protein
MSLTLDSVTVAHAGQALFAPISLDIAPGRITTLMGPSGAGKSSLLAAICGTLPAGLQAQGMIRLEGTDLAALPPERRNIGILFQDDLLFPHLSVAANLGFGLKPGPGRRTKIQAALAEAELPGLADRDPASLSGGQRARIALLRTLLSEPRALLLDEPFSRLDAALRDRFRRFVFDHAAQRGLPVLLVTHDPLDAQAAGGPVIHLQAAPTRFSFDPRTGTLSECEDAVAACFPDVPEITCADLAAMPDTIVLDIRSPAEHAVSRIPGSLRIDPGAQAGQVLQDLPADRRIVCTCAVGLRSARMARALIEAGLPRERVSNLRGGLFRWSLLGFAMHDHNGATRSVHEFNRDWGRLLRRSA